MAFNTLEELKAAVEERRGALLTLEVDLGTQYSVEYEAAKTELEQAKGMKMLTGGAFLGDNIKELEDRVAALKPEPHSVWVQYKRLPLSEWALLMKQANLGPVEQYEKVLPKTFVALFGEDPDPEEKPEGWTPPEPLSTEASLLSSRGDEGILPGGALNSVIQNFMAWQNSGGDVTIRPTKSGRD